MDGLLHLSKGKQTLVLRARALAGAEPFNLVLRSIELVLPDVQQRLQQQALRQRADVTWLQEC